MFGPGADQGFEFKKEPEYQGKDVKRGVIKPAEGTAKPIGYAWDKDGNRIYIDANRNGDLTDDGDNSFVGQKEYFQTVFRTVRASLPVGPAAIEYVFDLELEPFAQLTIRSGWRGDVELDGQKWRMEIADNLDGAFGEGDWFLIYKAGKPAPNLKGVDRIENMYPLQGKIALNGKVYALTLKFADGNALEAALKNEPMPVAEVSLEGQFVRYLWLDGPGFRALIDTPDATFPLPAASYAVSGVLIEGDSKHAMYCVPKNLLVAASESASTTLKIGGPLQSIITAKRHGNTLELGYALKGAGGEEYTPERDYDNPVRFVARQGEKQIGAGQLEYG